MENYKPNSYKSKQEERIESEPEIKPVISGQAKKQKKSGLSKMIEAYVQEDISDIKSYIIHDVVVPYTKQLLDDIWHSILYPGDRGRGGRPTVRAAHVSYDKVYRNDDRRSIRSSDRKQTYEYDTVTFASRGDAEAVLSSMDSILEKYNLVRVKDFYELSNISGEYTDMYYGWSDLTTAKIERVRDGYIIRLPKALPIDRR